MQSQLINYSIKTRQKSFYITIHHYKQQSFRYALGQVTVIAYLLLLSTG